MKEVSLAFAEVGMMRMATSPRVPWPSSTRKLATAVKRVPPRSGSGGHTARRSLRVHPDTAL